MIDKFVLPKLECPRCGHQWTPRTETPVRCPRCNKFLRPNTQGARK